MIDGWKRLRTLPMLVLLLAATAAAQEQSRRWKRHNDRGNRWEGRIEIPVGRPSIEVLSLFGFRESYAEGEELAVRFFVPGNGDVTLQARELEERVQYFMQAKDQDWTAGEWNTFGPWPTRVVLKREGVPAGNLAVLIRLVEGEGEGEQETLLPAFVYHSQEPEILESYRLHVRTGSDLSKLVYRLYREDEELLQGKLVDVDALEAFAIELEAAGLPAGRLRLELEGKPRGRLCGTENSSRCPGARRFFHHQPFEPKETDESSADECSDADPDPDC